MIILNLLKIVCKEVKLMNSFWILNIKLKLKPNWLPKTQIKNYTDNYEVKKK